MKKETYKDKTAAELKTLVAEKREALRAFEFGVAGSTTKNVKEGRNLRKEIARILTALSGQKQ